MQATTDYFSRPTTEALKGYLALGVLLHHIYQSTHFIRTDTVLGFFLDSLGAYCVSFFFFISGYGLLTSFNRNGGGYLCNYQRNRALPLFCINALLVVVYATLKTLLGIEVTTCNIVLSFFYGGDIVTNGWFLLVIMLFYEMFYLAAKYFSKSVCMTVSILTLAYIGISVLLKMPGWWHMSCLAFPCGLLFSKYKQKIDIALSRHHLILMTIIALLFLGSFSFMYETSCNPSFVQRIPHFDFVHKCFSATRGVFFSCLVVCLLNKAGTWLKAESPISHCLSSIYLETYVLQGIAIHMVRNAWNINDNYTAAIAIFILTLLLAVTMHPLFKQIISAVKVPQKIKTNDKD